jgi:hypothetical protein
MLNSQTALPYGAPAATIIVPGRSPWLIFVPGMEQPKARNLGLTVFLRDVCARSGHGFASFQSAKPEYYDDTAHSMAAHATLHQAVLAFGRRDEGFAAIVAAATRERVVAQRTASQAKGLAGATVEPIIFEPQVFESLPARVAFAKSLALTSNSLRNRRFAQLSRT